MTTAADYSGDVDGVVCVKFQVSDDVIAEVTLHSAFVSLVSSFDDLQQVRHLVQSSWFGPCYAGCGNHQVYLDIQRRGDHCSRRH